MGHPASFEGCSTYFRTKTQQRIEKIPRRLRNYRLEVKPSQWQRSTATHLEMKLLRLPSTAHNLPRWEIS